MKVLKRISVYLIPLLLLGGCTQSRPTFSEAVTHFDKTTKGTSTMYFYPAVLDVLNYGGDSTLALAIRDIKKIKIVRLSKDTIQRTIADSLIDGVKSEHFVNLMEMRREGYQINLFMKKQSHEVNQYVAVAYSSKSMMVVDLLGNIPFKYLPLLLNSSTNFEGFTNVLNAKKDRRNKKDKNDKSKSEDGERTRDK